MIDNWVLMFINFIGAFASLFLVGANADDGRPWPAIFWSILFAFNIGSFVLHLSILIQATS